MTLYLCKSCNKEIDEISAKQTYAMYEKSLCVDCIKKENQTKKNNIIKHSDLMRLGLERGISSIQFDEKFDEKSQEWESKAYVYPSIPKEILESFKGIDLNNLKTIVEHFTMPTTGIGRANFKNTKPNMHAWLRELAQTRAVNRALRNFISAEISEEEII